MDKPALLAKEKGLTVEMVDDIKPYSAIGYEAELKEWKNYLMASGQPVKIKYGIK
jgi:hypothetical protein